MNIKVSVNQSKRRSTFKCVIAAVFLAAVLFSCKEQNSTHEENEVSVYVPEDFAGMCHSGYSSNLEKEYGMLNEMGVIWLHRDFSWSSIQPKEGEWDFSQFDNYVAQGNAENKKIMGMLLYDVKWVHDKFGNPDERKISQEELPYFVEYAKETVKRYNGKNGHGKVDVWLIWNEPDLTPTRFWKGTKEEFFNLTKETAKAIRELDQQEGTTTILIGGVFSLLVLDDAKWITGLFESGAMSQVDLISVHPYGVSPTMSASLFKRFKDKVASYGFSDKIWVNEMGYPTYSQRGDFVFDPAGGGRYGTDQYEGDMPDVAVKTFVLLAAAGAKNLTWYHLFDGATRDNKNSENWFGLVWQKTNDDWERKGGYYGYAISAANIPGKTYKEKTFFSGSVSDKIQSYYFQGDDGKHSLVVWNTHISKEAEVTITLKGNNHKLWNAKTGESTPINATSTYTLFPPNKDQQNLVFITWEE